jgi:uncharacterized protein (UPF0332 family)
MNEEATGYLQKAKDCLADAEYLLDGNRIDASCNRSYYAIFDAIQALLSLTEDIYFKTHQGAHTKFRELYIKTNKLPLHFSETLTEALNLRQGGDYELDFEITSDKAHTIFRKATEFVKLIETYLSDNT